MAANHLACFVLIVAAVLIPSLADECARRYYDRNSFICVCNSTYCDTAPTVGPLAAGKATLILSTRADARFQTSDLEFVDFPNSLDAQEIIIDSSIRKQKIIGFGGAFTDAAGINIAQLSVVAQERLMRSYYSSEGIEYGIGRIPIAGTDFSIRTYSYCDDCENDVTLANFSLTFEDLVYKIPYVDWAKSLSSKPIKLFSSPWSAPKWMKSNNEFYGQGYLLEEYYQAWADYFVKFFDEYKKHNIEFWGVTAQNEPADGNIPNFSFNCMGWNAETQAMFVGLNLGPTMEAAGYGDVKIMIMDDQRIFLPAWPEKVLAHPEANKYVAGIAVHWYGDIVSSPGILTTTHEMFPDRFIFGTEACEGDKPWQVDVPLGAWERLETYALDIIQDLNNWVTGWTDWNLALDLGGGPNWSGNFVDAPVIVNATADEFYKQPIFYAMGHFSKYIPEDSVGLNVELVNSTRQVSATAFERPDGMKSVVILNRNDEDTMIVLKDEERGYLEFNSPARSLQTIVYG